MIDARTERVVVAMLVTAAPSGAPGLVIGVASFVTVKA
jgi:hypothetical protein